MTKRPGGTAPRCSACRRFRKVEDLRVVHSSPDADGVVVCRFCKPMTQAEELARVRTRTTGILAERGQEKHVYGDAEGRKIVEVLGSVITYGPHAGKRSVRRRYNPPLPETPRKRRGFWQRLRALLFGPEVRS